MGRLLLVAALVVLVWRLVAGRWPWEAKSSPHERKLRQARRLLGLAPAANSEDVQSAHRRLLATVHPDRGGSNAQVHEANEARDLLLAHLHQKSKESA